MRWKTLQPTESQEQIAVMDWAAQFEPQIPELRMLLAIPNGGSRSYRVDKNGKRYSPEGKRLKREGVKRGVPDLLFPVKRLNCSGLWIEMKTKTGRMSAAQKMWAAAIIEQGFAVKLCRDSESAIKAIMHYLLLPRS